MPPTDHIQGLLLFRVLCVVSVLVFGYSAWRRLCTLLDTRPLLRMDRHFERLKGMLLRVFFQKKLFYDPIPGLAHAFIFWGFCIISFESLHFFLSAFGFNFRLPLTRGIFCGIYELSLAMVAIGVTYAMARRLFFRTRVLHSWDGLLVLGLILGLVFTGLVISAQESALAGVRNSWKLVTNPFNAAESVGAYSAAWWIHGLIFLFFLNYLPYSKHFHVLTVAFNVYFRDLEPRGRMPKLDIENEDRFGLADRRDLTFKDILDGYTCTECGRCTVACPANRAGKNLDPKNIILDIRNYVWETERNSPEDGAEPQPIIENFIKKEDVFDCTTCHACVTACPVENEHLSKILRLRQSLVLMEGDMPEEYESTFRNLENNANPWGISRDQRGEITRDLGLPTLEEKPDAEYIYFLGCAGCYDSRAKSVVHSFTRILQHAGIDCAVLGDMEFCCGDPARRMGNEYLFQTMVGMNQEIIEECHLAEKKILTTDPHCFNTLKNEYSDFGMTLHVEHHSTFLHRLLAEGRIKPEPRNGCSITYHDSCYMARYNGAIQEPRQSLTLLGYTVQEMKSSGRESMCCGAGGGRAFVEEDPSHRVNAVRVKEALEANSVAVAVACPYCAIMFEDGIKAEKSDLKVHDLAELVSECLPQQGSALAQVGR